MKENNRSYLTGQKSRRLTASCSFILGSISAVFQIILIRELIRVFGGSELSVAVVLAVWLVGVSVGSAWAYPRGIMWVAGLLGAAWPLFLLTLFGARSLRLWLGIPVGSMVGIGPLVLGSVCLLLPLSIVLGAVFAVLARISGDGRRIYAWEALGFLAGGVLMTWFFAVPMPGGLGRLSEQAAWPGYRLEISRQTRYGHLEVVERGGQRSFFENGRHLFTAGDALSAEEVHPAFLAHPAPRRAFLVGGGFSQSGREALKHPLMRLDYAELDPALLDLEQGVSRGNSDGRLRILAGDPRSLLRQAVREYDVIAINVGDPTDLLTARFFTREFAATAHERLLPGGVLALSIGLSGDYVGPQGMAYARSVMTTLASVFRSVQIIPGDRMTFIASDVFCRLTPELLSRRLKERGIRTDFMRGYYLNDRMSLARVDAARMWLARPGELSTDMRPVVAWRALVFAVMRTGDGLYRWMGTFEHWGWVVVMLPVVFGLAGLFRRPLVPLAGAGIGGFTQMVFQVTTVLAVQMSFGHVYAVVGLLMAAFMLGLFAGTRSYRIGADVPVRMQAWLAFCFIAVMMYWPAGLFVVPVLAGIAGGMQFSACSAMAGEGRAGKVYAADVIGAAFGAVCAGLFMVPLWGMTTTMILVAGLNVAAGWVLRRYPASVSAER